MIINRFPVIRNVGEDIDRTSNAEASSVRAPPNLPTPVATTGTREPDKARGTFLRMLWKFEPRANADWRIQALQLRARQDVRQNIGAFLKNVEASFRAPMKVVPVLKTKDALARSLISHLYGQGRMPAQTRDVIAKADKLNAKFKNALATAKRNAGIAAISGNRPSFSDRRTNLSRSALGERQWVSFPLNVDRSLYSILPPKNLPFSGRGVGLRPVMDGRQLRSWHTQDGARYCVINEPVQTMRREAGINHRLSAVYDQARNPPVSTRMSSGDYVALSDSELDDLVPFLVQEDRSPQNRTGHTALPSGAYESNYTTLSEEEFSQLLPFIGDNPVNCNAASTSPTPTSDQPPQAELLIPVTILHPELLGGVAQYDKAQQNEVIERWRKAMQLLLDHRANPPQAPSPEEAEFVRKRRSIGGPRPGALDANFDWEKVALRDTPGGGDCLLHALEEGRTSQKQNVQHILDLRQKVTGMRRANPGDPRGNRYSLVSALKDVAPRLDEPWQWDHIVPKEGVSNELLAAFDACPGMYGGTDMIIQWTMLEGNRDKTVIAVDAGYTDPSGVRIQPDFMAYKNGQQVSLGDSMLTNDRLNDLLKEKYIVIRNKDQHWQSVYLPSEG